MPRPQPSSLRRRRKIPHIAPPPYLGARRTNDASPRPERVVVGNVGDRSLARQTAEHRPAAEQGTARLVQVPAVEGHQVTIPVCPGQPVHLVRRVFSLGCERSLFTRLRSARVMRTPFLGTCYLPAHRGQTRHGRRRRYDQKVWIERRAAGIGAGIEDSNLLPSDIGALTQLFPMLQRVHAAQHLLAKRRPAAGRREAGAGRD